MSSPSDGNEKKDDHSAYAPKWVRDSNRETSHESPSIGEKLGIETVKMRGLRPEHKQK